MWRINEIKYLARQKKVPKLTLQKQIVHLEQQLRSIFELERKILSGDISENRLNESVKRIIRIKKELGIFEWNQKSFNNPQEILGNQEHLNIIKTLKKSIK